MLITPSKHQHGGVSVFGFHEIGTIHMDSQSNSTDRWRSSGWTEIVDGEVYILSYSSLNEHAALCESDCTTSLTM